MISKSTVFILGAGASAPYGFDTGERLLERARALKVESIADLIRPLPRHGAAPLHDALIHTGDQSIDAMLETNGPIQAPGKALIARLLLQQEREALSSNHTSPRGWYRTLFTAMTAPTPREAVAQQVRFVTFNYDRSLEYCLAHAWRVKYNPDQLVDPAGLQRMFIHLHGQLGFLPEIGGTGPVVGYGGSSDGTSDSDILISRNAIQIISEAHTEAPQFAQAHDAIRAADRVVFIGFNFAERNVERLQLQSCMKPGAAVFACLTALSPARRAQVAHGVLEPWTGKVLGVEAEDAYEFLRQHPNALT
jgi:hypothetical protein